MISGLGRVVKTKARICCHFCDHDVCVRLAISIEPNFDCKSNVFRRSMDRFGGSLPVKGYSGEMAGKKRVQLPVDLGKGRRLVFIFSL